MDRRRCTRWWYDARVASGGVIGESRGVLATPALVVDNGTMGGAGSRRGRVWKGRLQDLSQTGLQVTDFRGNLRDLSPPSSDGGPIEAHLEHLLSIAQRCALRRPRMAAPLKLHLDAEPKHLCLCLSAVLGWRPH